MHAMRPPQLSAAIRIPQHVDRALPIGTYDPLAAAAAAARPSLPPAAAAGHLVHVTPLRPDPFTTATHSPGSSTPAPHSVSTLHARTSSATAALQSVDEEVAPVATLSTAGLQILRLPGDAPVATVAAPVEVMAQLPLSAVCSTAVDGRWIEVVFTTPAGRSHGGADSVVLPVPIQHGTSAEDRGRGSGGAPQHSTLAETTQSAAAAAGGAVQDAARVAGTLPPAQSRAADAVDDGEGGGLPFRVLRVCCANSEGAAALRAAIVRQQATRREMLRRRATLEVQPFDGPYPPGRSIL